MNNVFDSGIKLPLMYRAWVFPDLFPDERQPVLKNWHPDDLEDYAAN